MNILVTGSFAKHNTAALLHGILPEAAVFVVSLNHLEDLPCMPDLVVVTSISPYPLPEGFSSYRDLLDAVSAFALSLSTSSVFYVNGDFRFLSAIFHRRYRWFSASDLPVERSLLRLPGDRNLIPYLAASAVGAAYAEKTSVISCLLSFTGCPGHFQVVDKPVPAAKQRPSLKGLYRVCRISEKDGDPHRIPRICTRGFGL